MELNKYQLDRDNQWIREPVKRLQRIRDSYENRYGMFRMDRNERTWPFSENILDEIRQRITSETLTNYPAIEPLYEKLAEHLGVKEDQIYFHSGSDLVIKSVYETYIEKGDRVLLQNPSYAMYGVYGRLYEADIITQDYNKDICFDLAKYLSIIREYRPKMAVLENPNGYLGNSFSKSQVESFVRIASECGTLALVDEAYVDYLEDNAVSLLSDFDNLIIVRTFSKAWGLAGMRVGYALSNRDLIKGLFQVMPMHELTSTSIVGAEVLLDHKESVREYVNEVKEVREQFMRFLMTKQVNYVKSDTHFVTAHLGDILDMESFRRKAHDNGYFVRRPFGQDFLKEWVRIGLLPMKEMASFESLLGKMIDDAGEIKCITF